MHNLYSDAVDWVIRLKTHKISSLKCMFCPGLVWDHFHWCVLGDEECAGSAPFELQTCPFKIAVKSLAGAGIQEAEPDPYTCPAVDSRSAVGNTRLLSRTLCKEAEHFTDGLMFSD